MKKTQINNKPLILGRQVSRRDFIRGSAALGIAGTTAGTLLTTGNAFAAGGKRGGRLRAGIAHGSTTDSLDPATYENNFTIQLDYAIHNHLGEVDAATGAMVPELAESWDQLAMMQNFFLTPLSFLGGIFYSIKMLPEWAQTLSFINPIYYMINGIRYTVLGVSDSDVHISFIMAIILTAGFTLAAILLMQSGKKIKQ